MVPRTQTGFVPDERRRILVTLVTPERTTTQKATGTRTITGGALACEALLAAGATVLFGYPGGAALPFYRELARYPRLRLFHRHEAFDEPIAIGQDQPLGVRNLRVDVRRGFAERLLLGVERAVVSRRSIRLQRKIRTRLSCSKAWNRRKKSKTY